MANKRLERWYVEQLRRAIQDFPNGDMRESESPDFIVESDAGAVGIEVTVFHSPPPIGERPHQEQQALKDRVVAIAHKAHNDAGGPALYVSVFFSEPIAATKRDLHVHGEAVARAVLQVEPPSSLDEPAATVPWDRLPPGIVDITIRASIDGDDQLWSADAGGWVAPVQPSHLEGLVARKAKMLTIARTKCALVWLVVVNDEFSRAAPVELSDEAREALYEPIFDRIIWLEPHQLCACDLKTSVEQDCRRE